MTNKLSDSWQTPQYLFDELNQEFSFDIDLCATKGNSKCDMYCTDYLNNKYNEVLNPFTEDGDLIISDEKDPTKFGDLAYYKEDVTCFMNPPFSNPKLFIEKAWEDSKYCKIVCLVKCDPSTKWWATFWQYRDKCDLCDDGLVDYEVCHRCNGDNYISGPKPGCEVRFFPKRIKFDPPIGYKKERITQCGNKITREEIKLSGPAFSCALVIMDRRGLE